MNKYIEVAKKIIEERYAFAGVRTVYDDEQYEIGDTCRDSYEHDLENDCSTYHTTGLTAGGTCATNIEIDRTYYDAETEEEEIEEMARKIAEAVEQNAVYGNATSKQIIIAGYSQNREYDLTDDNEIRIIDAEVIAFV